jgi:hypothetical protein
MVGAYYSLYPWAGATVTAVIKSFRDGTTQNVVIPSRHFSSSSPTNGALVVKLAGLVSNNINVAGFIERKTIHIIKELYYKTGTIREILRGTFFWFFGIMYNIKISS